MARPAAFGIPAGPRRPPGHRRELLERGEIAEDAGIRETQERLEACSYAMAHPDTGELVPACAQHSVLDPLENQRLQTELPLMELPMASA